MNRIALAVLVLVLGITTGAEAQPKKRDDDAAGAVKKAPAVAHALRWERDGQGQWAITPAIVR